ncbi:MAG TPA: choice-of-anchor L domain-containing protein, partial [Chitinophagales bacterium]|nr:choice-of-anchor L domain-containing protein [Chitinophagales bacterium]
MKRFTLHTICPLIFLLSAGRVLAACPDGEIAIQIQTDNFGSQTGWEIIDISNGITVDSLLPGYLTDNTLYNWSVCVSSSGCYWVRITDTGGDGLSGGGYYDVSFNGSLVENGTSFSSVETVIAGQCQSICGDDKSVMFVELLTDNNPGQTSWEITNTLTTAVEFSQAAGSLGNRVHYLWAACIDSLGCYSFRISDSGNNGLSSPAFFRIYLNGNTSVGSGSGNFGASRTISKIGNCVYGGCSTDSIRIQLRTDFFPAETGWQMIDVTTNTIVARVNIGDLFRTNFLHTWSVCTNASHCYEVVFLDQGNNGICCSWGSGYYRVYKNGTLIQQGGSFESAETVGMMGNCSNPCGAQSTITVQIHPDNYGSEITWELLNQNTQTVIATGGPYIDGNNDLIKTNVCVPAGGCYEVIVHDEFGDGMCCANGDGYYIVSYNNAVFGSGGIYGNIDFQYGIGGFCSSPVIVTDNDNYTPEELVEDILLGACVDVFNVEYTGAPEAIGYFSNGGSLGLQNGILLTTGSTDVAVGPNNAPDATYIAGQPGDSDLESAAGLSSNSTFDACVLEFDFIPYNNTITFNYIFASEEYPEYVCSAFNDAFAFLVTGPGYPPNTNVALIPSTTIPVAINSVNGGMVGAFGSPGGCSPPNGSLAYTAYYVNNTGGLNVQYDGYTVPLTATISVTPCQTYHIKLVIADVGDQVLDSGVFIEAQSFSGGDEVTVTAGADVYEGCNSSFTFTRSDVTSSSLLVNFTVSGTAANGTDYNSISSSITIPPNQASYTLNIQTILDALNESSESVIISLMNVCTCSGSNKDTLLILNTTPAVITPASASICSGQSTTLTASGGGTYSWSTGSASSSITVSPSSTTTYTVTVSNGGCAQTVSATVTVNSPPTASISPANVTICSGQSATLTASGGGTYSWSTGATTATITVSPSSTTTYTVTVTNGSGCTATASRLVTVTSGPSASISPATATICTGQNVTLTASGSGGNSPYNFSWSTGSTNASITVSPASSTTYNVTVTDANGCTATSSRTVTVNSPPTAAITNPGAICSGQSVTLTASGAGAGGSYLWSTGSTNASITVSPASSTTYNVTVTDANGCSATASRTINVSPQPNITPSGASICNGASATLTATGGTSYTWSTGATTASITVNPSTTTTYNVTVTDAGGCTATASSTVTVTSTLTASITPPSAAVCLGSTITLTASGGTTYSWSTGATTQSITVSPVSNTIYSVTVTDGGSCSASASRSVTINPNPIASISPATLAICTGASTTLTANGGGTYSWSTGEASTTITVNPSSTTTYSVTVTDGNGCTASASRTVNVNPLPTPSISPGNVTICNGASATLTAGGGNSFSWSNGSTTASITVSPSTTTSYSVTVTDANGCSASAARTVTVNPNPTASISPAAVSICDGASATLTASGGNSYSWSSGSTNAGITVSPASTTSYSVTVSDANGCTATASATVTVNPLPAASVTPNNPSVCAGSSATLTASGGTSYSWSTGSTNASITVSPASTATYNVTVTNSGGCTASASATVTVSPSLTASISPAALCAGGSATLTASGGTTYSWSTGATSQSITVSPASTTSYSVTVTDGGSCSASASRTVTVNPNPTASISPAAVSICDGASATLTASGGNSYSWS